MLKGFLNKFAYIMSVSIYIYNAHLNDLPFIVSLAVRLGDALR